MSNSIDVSQMRRSYADEGLLRNTLPEEPFALFQHWFTQYVDLDIFEPNAMVVATVGKNAAPSEGVRYGWIRVLYQLWKSKSATNRAE